MTAVWFGFVGLFILRLIKRHGWEYVPVMLLALGLWYYFGSRVGSLGDGVLLATVTGVHFVTRRDTPAAS